MYKKTGSGSFGADSAGRPLGKVKLRPYAILPGIQGKNKYSTDFAGNYGAVLQLVKAVAFGVYI